MAVDEAILEGAVSNPTTGATLRWYRWKEPTLSLGYFQQYASRPASLRDLPCTRRLTGGGAILHDIELTYSLVIPAGQWPHDSAGAMVRQFHYAVAEALRTVCDARMHPGRPESKDEPFLCFLRRSSSDLVLGEHKILGSAQRNRRGALLQHGSILLQPSVYEPSLTGLSSVPQSITPENLAEKVTSVLQQKWGLRIFQQSLTDEELQMARHLEQSKYLSPEWNQRR